MKLIEIDGQIFNPGVIETVTDVIGLGCEVLLISGRVLTFKHSSKVFKAEVEVALQEP
jgi:hypothetical protein